MVEIGENMSVLGRIGAGVGAGFVAAGGAAAAPVHNLSPGEAYALNNPAPAIHATYEPPTHDWWQRVGELGENVQKMGGAHADGAKRADEVKQAAEIENHANSQEYADHAPPVQSQANEFDTSQIVDDGQDYDNGMGY